MIHRIFPLFSIYVIYWNESNIYYTFVLFLQEKRVNIRILIMQISYVKTERGAKLLQHKIFSRVKWFRSCCVTTIQIALMYKRCIYVIHISRFSSKRKGCNKFFDYSSFIKQENLLIYYLSETVIGVKFCEF